MPIPPSLSVVSLYHIGKESVKRRLNGGGFRRKTGFKKLAKANRSDKKAQFSKRISLQYWTFTHDIYYNPYGEQLAEKLRTTVRG
jgi:hypothetical protein